MGRKALVNYKVSYTTESGYSSIYECTKLMWCDRFGKVTETTLGTWELILEEEEANKLSLQVSNIKISITNFTKLDPK